MLVNVIKRLAGLAGILGWGASAATSYGQTVGPVGAEQAQQTWNEYFERIKNRRLSEAEIIWSDVEANGVTEETVLAIDFQLFCGEEAGAQDAGRQLSENYNVVVTFRPCGRI